MSKRLTQEKFEEKFYMKYPTEFKVIGLYKDAQTPIDVKCNKCGHIITHTPNNFDKGKSKCPVCNINGDTRKTIIKVNDMWTTHPNIAQWLSNYNDRYNYRYNTLTELDFVCPNCNKHRIARPNSFKNGFVCYYCSDNISYPNKFMANILDLCGIKFRSEFRFLNSKYRYDFCFEFNQSNYLIEMDGGYGHGNVDTSYTTVQEQLEIDEIKNQLAKKNNYKLIRINCNYDTIDNRFSFISQNILQSELNTLFVLSKELLDQANILSQQNYLNKFVDCWNNGIRSYDEYFKILHVNHRSTVRYYAKRTIELGLLDISYEDFLKQIRLSSNKKLAHTKGFPVMCEQTHEVFYSIAEAERKMNLPSLHSYFYKNYSYCGTLPDGTKLTWKKNK